MGGKALIISVVSVVEGIAFVVGGAIGYVIGFQRAQALCNALADLGAFVVAAAVIAVSSGCGNRDSPVKALRDA